MPGLSTNRFLWRALLGRPVRRHHRERDLLFHYVDDGLLFRYVDQWVVAHCKQSEPEGRFVNHAPHPVTPSVGNSLPVPAVRWRVRCIVAALALPATIIGGPGLGMAAGLAHPDCLWAGEAHPQNAAVITGGWSFTCESDTGAPVWRRGPATSRHSTVRTPGAATDPVGVFSVGAQQPGTTYVDRCVGSQLVEGRDDLYEAFSDDKGGLVWKPVESVAAWTFDPGSVPPPPSWRDASLCIDGVLT